MVGVGWLAYTVHYSLSEEEKHGGEKELQYNSYEEMLREKGDIRWVVRG